MQEGHDQQGDDQRDRVDQRLGHAPFQERALHEGGDGRLADRADDQRTCRDAQLRRRELDGHVLDAAQRVLGAGAAGQGHGLDLVATGRDHGELGGDEERVEGQHGHEDGDCH